MLWMASARYYIHRIDKTKCKNQHRGQVIAPFKKNKKYAGTKFIVNFRRFFVLQNNSQSKNIKTICISLKRQPHSDAFNHIFFDIF